MERLLTTACLEGIDYRESENLTQLGGFLMTFKDQRRITMNARLTEADKTRGIEYLLNHLTQLADEAITMHLWTWEAEAIGT